MGKEGFIAVGYQDKDNVRTALDAISQALEKHGITPVLCVDDEALSDPAGSMPEVLKRVQRSVVFIAEVSRKRIGVGIEAGVAYCHGIPIVYVYRSGVEESMTLRGISNHEIVYESPKHLGEQLDEFLVTLEVS